MTASPDSVRDALALVLCSLRNDQEGSGVIKANAANPGEVAGVLADIVAELFKPLSRVLAGGDPLALLDRVRAELAGRDGLAN